VRLRRTLAAFAPDRSGARGAEPPQDARVGPANAAHPLRPPNFFAEKVAAWVRLAERAERADAPSGSCGRGIVEARQGRDRLAKLRDRLLRAVRSNPTRKFCARRIRCSVLPDCAFALGERAGFVTVERHSASEAGPIQRLQREEIGARAAHPSHIDLRAGDAAGHLEPLPAGLRPRDGTGQGGNLVRECGIKPRGTAQTVPDGIARGARLALRCLGSAAAAAVPAAGFPPRFTDHAGCGGASRGASGTSSASSA
jgi:hypothetical protein